MDKLIQQIGKLMKDKRKRTIAVGAGIGVATIIAGIITFTTRKKRK